MKIRWKLFTLLFTTSFLISILIGLSSYFILKNGYFSRFQARYESSFTFLKNELSSIELDAGKIALNAALVFKEYESKYGEPNPQQIEKWRKLLSVSDFFIINNKGDFTYLSNGLTPEGVKRDGYNLFKMCSGYKRLLTEGGFEQTPIIYQKIEPNKVGSIYTMVPSLDKKRILEVRISVDSIFDRLNDRLKYDSTIKQLSLFTPTKISLFSKPISDKYHSEITKLSQKLADRTNIFQWVKDDILFLTKLTPHPKHERCCECEQKGIISGGNYYYILSAVLSSEEFYETLLSTYFKLGSSLLVAIVISLFISTNLSKGLSDRLKLISTHFKKFKSKDISEFLPIEISGADEITELAKQFNYLIEGAQAAQRRKLEVEISEAKSQQQARLEQDKKEALEEQARQVKHDASTPLRALEMQINEVVKSDLDRSELRYALNRVTDMINSLVTPVHALKLDSHMLISLTEQIVSESRRAHKDTPQVKIEFSYSDSSYRLFAEVQPDLFQRVLSNVIKNSVQAIIPSPGVVTLELEEQGIFSTLIIHDNGKGIPEQILPKIFEKNFTHDKEGGSGLGLSQARELISSWRGEITASSVVGVGTQVRITIPKAKSPNWFVKNINLPADFTLVIVDDDQIIHDFWAKRVENLKSEQSNIKGKVIHIYSREEFNEWFSSRNTEEKYTFLVDCNLSNYHDSDGIDLIVDFKLKACSYLVTNRWNEDKTQEKCNEFGIGMIPKNLIHIVPLMIRSESQVKYDVVIIDDDRAILNRLEQKAKRLGKRILTFTCTTDFLRMAPFISRDTDICIDSDLKSEKKGEEMAQEFKDDFDNIFSISAVRDVDFTTFYWIKGYRAKDNPWQSPSC